MKIAKKVLAVVMAVAMIACLSAMAFAADGKVTLKASEVADGKFKVEVLAKDYADLQSANWVVKYDAAVLKCSAAKYGAGLTTAILDGELMQQFNNTVDGEVQIGYAFTNNLGTADETVLFYMDFEVEDTAAKKVTIALSGDDTATIDVVLKAEEETTEAPTTAEPTTAEPTTAEPTTKAPTTEAPTTAEPTTKAPTTTNKTDGKPTGDTGVLAIAAGVVALAGAAFVVSKKRK